MKRMTNQLDDECSDVDVVGSSGDERAPGDVSHEEVEGHVPAYGVG